MHQATLPGLRRTNAALEQLAQANASERGAVFTRREVVAFILDLVGYIPNAPLHTRRILEPSFVGFTASEADELLSAWLIQGDSLLTPFAQHFSYVVGNPPYIRQELIPRELM